MIADELRPARTEQSTDGTEKGTSNPTATTTTTTAKDSDPSTWESYTVDPINGATNTPGSPPIAVWSERLVGREMVEKGPKNDRRTTFTFEDLPYLTVVHPTSHSGNQVDWRLHIMFKEDVLIETDRRIVEKVFYEDCWMSDEYKKERQTAPRPYIKPGNV